MELTPKEALAGPISCSPCIKVSHARLVQRLRLSGCRLLRDRRHPVLPPVVELGRAQPRFLAKRRFAVREGDEPANAPERRSVTVARKDSSRSLFPQALRTGLSLSERKYAPCRRHAEEEVVLRHALAAMRCLPALDKVALDHLRTDSHCQLSRLTHIRQKRRSRRTSDMPSGILKSAFFISAINTRKASSVALSSAAPDGLCAASGLT